MYTGIMDSFWTDKKVYGLSDDAKLLFLYLLSCQHRNIIGFYRIPIAYIGADLNWKPERVSKGLDELSRNGHIKYDEAVSIVLILNFLKYNTIDNGNIEKSAVKKFKELEDTPLTLDFMRSLERLGNPYQTLYETVSKHMPTTEPEPEPEPEPEVCLHGAIKTSAPCRPASSAPPVICLTLNDKSEYPIPEDQIQQWSELFPAVDILQELRKMKGWLDANPAKRKTKKGILRFVNTWLSKEQDKGGSKNKTPTAVKKNYDTGDDFLRG